MTLPDKTRTNRLLRSLARQYPPVTAESLRDSGIRWVVVLGGGASSDPDLPAVSRLAESSLAHAIEGVRLHRQFPGSKIILTGGSVFGTVCKYEGRLKLSDLVPKR